MRPINPLPRGADLQKQKDGLADPEQSPPAKGRHLLRVRIDYVAGFIPSEEGQTSSHTLTSHRPTIHPFLRRADFCHKPIDASHIDSSLPTKGSPQNLSRHITAFRFIPSCEGQTLSVYAAFNHSKHPVVHFAQTPFSPHHMPSSLYLICRKNIFFITFLNIFQNSSTLIPYSSSITISLHSPTRYIFTSLKMPVSG